LCVYLKNSEPGTFSKNLIQLYFGKVKMERSFAVLFKYV